MSERNSVSFGDGVYKSTDGGKTWQHMGLRNSERVSKTLINPRNPDVVYVGALAHAFGANEERGVFMTSDGGKTWTKTLYIDAEHGVADMNIDPSNPNILYAAMWKFRRAPWTHASGDERGGLFKSVDGGRTWKKLETGLPKLLRRVGVSVAASNPNVVYAITEAKEGKLYRLDDRGETWRNTSKQTSIVSRGLYYAHVRVDPANENRVIAVASTLFLSVDGGRTFRSITGRTHIDYHALWLDPQNPRRMGQGQEGGFAVTEDGGDSWEVINNIPVGQFYQIHADNRQPFYYIMGGLQNNGTWTGPSRTREPAGIMNDDWRMVSFGDGFYALNHPDDPELYLTESQGGNIVRTDFRTLDSLKAQVEFIERTVKDRLTDVPKELSDRLTEQKKKVEESQNRLAQPEGGLGFSGKAQLVDRIGNLFFTIDGVNAGPTPAQRELYGELQKEYDEKIAAVNKFLSETVPQLNETLRRFGAPTLMSGKPIELPKP